jgi:hypothetical protein
MDDTFDAYVLEEQGPAVLRQLGDEDLPDAEVTVDVGHSSLNHGFGELTDLAGQIPAGQVRGRVVIEIGW